MVSHGRLIAVCVVASSLTVAGALPGHASQPTATPQFTPAVQLTVPSSSQLVAGALPYGLAQGEPTIRSDSAGSLYVMAPGSTPIGCELWVKPAGASSFSFHVPPDLGVGGGDCDLVTGPAAGQVAYSSLSLADITVGASSDGANTFSTPNPVGSPIAGDDRQWMATDGTYTYLTTHFVASDNIGVLRSSDGGRTYSLAGLAIDPAHIAQAAYNNELGPIVVDTSSTANPKPIYTIFTAPSTALANVNSVAGTLQNANNGVYLASSNDGGATWVDTPIWIGPTSETYDHIFPALGIDAGGNLWAAFSDENHIFLTHAGTRGSTIPGASLLDAVLDPGSLVQSEALQSVTATGLQWTVPTQIDSTSTAKVFPWIVGGGNGRAALIWYGGTAATPGDTSNQWMVNYAQLRSTHSGLQVSSTVASINPDGSNHVNHNGGICETGVTCSVNGDRTLLDFLTEAITPDGRLTIAFANDGIAAGAGVVYTTTLCSGVNLLTGKALTSSC